MLRPRLRDRHRDGAFADRLIGRADGYRDTRHFGEAGVLYAEALCLDPMRFSIQVQAGHMFKEAGDFVRAAEHYDAAHRLRPGDADLILQLGHFSKVVGDYIGAAAYYEEAARLRPDWHEPPAALALLKREAGIAAAGDGASTNPAPLPELLPRPREEAPAVPDRVELLRYAQRRERTPWGLMPTLSGIEAIRGYGVAAKTLTAVELLVDDAVVASGPVQPFKLNGGLTKYVFNLWHDFTAMAGGVYDITVRLVGDDGVVRQRRDRLMIRPAISEAEHPEADSIVSDVGSSGDLDSRIRARPSQIRPALRGRGWPVPTRVLVIRADQLGDLVVSVPALRRLRALLPGATISGLLTEANANIARRLALFDEVIVVHFPDEPDKGGRYLEKDEQERLQALLHAHCFDLAIDLSTSGMSRPLLLLAGATRTLGFGGEQWPWLSSEVGGVTPDVRNRIEAVPHAGKISTLIDRLAGLLNSGAVVEPLPPDDRAALAALPGLDANAPYAVLHAGGRLVFSRWAGYSAIARRMIEERGLAVVLLTEDASLAAALPPSLTGDPRFVLVTSRLEGTTLDALLGFADLVVANDSGPKHLAALRGTPVVSIHSARINWNEWGQEQTGVIVSRRVPCAGCAIHHDVENCGKGYACIADITVDEVMAAISLALSAPAPSPPASSSSDPASARPAPLARHEL